MSLQEANGKILNEIVLAREKRQDITWEYVAEILSTTPQTLFRIRRGERCFTLEEIDKLAKVFPNIPNIMGEANKLMLQIELEKSIQAEQDELNRLVQLNDVVDCDEAIHKVGERLCKLICEMNNKI